MRLLRCCQGHKIKDPSRQISQAVRLVMADNRFILSGTPIQNTLHEMWALFDFTCNGTLLGTSRSFKQYYENPIVASQDRNATAEQQHVGQELAQSLRELIAPYFLRREKKSTLLMATKPAEALSSATGSECISKTDVISPPPGVVMPGLKVRPICCPCCGRFIDEWGVSAYRFLRDTQIGGCIVI